MIEMTMTLTHLGTGSRGNATLLETEQAKVLIDQGFTNFSEDQTSKETEDQAQKKTEDQIEE